jgi:hypothetical protein
MVRVSHPLDQVHGLQPPVADQRVGLDKLGKVGIGRHDVFNDDRGDCPERAFTEGQKVIEDHSK